MKKRIIHILILIVFIALVSYAIITIKDKLNETELDKMDDVSDIASTLVDINTDDTSTADNGNNPIIVETEEQITVNQGAIAVIDIPSVGIRGQVVEGTDDNTLKNYIGKFKGCAYPGEYGNFSVAAHNNIYTEIFRDLYKVKPNDEVRVITTKYEYIYKVSSVEKIAPTQIEVLNADLTKKEITLITCADMSRTRIVVKGELVSQTEI